MELLSGCHAFFVQGAERPGVHGGGFSLPDYPSNSAVLRKILAANERK
jgi:hypothetical protein